MLMFLLQIEQRGREMGYQESSVMMEALRQETQRKEQENRKMQALLRETQRKEQETQGKMEAMRVEMEALRLSQIKGSERED
jgi:hypothetical protein